MGGNSIRGEVVAVASAVGLLSVGACVGARALLWFRAPTGTNPKWHKACRELRWALACGRWWGVSWALCRCRVPEAFLPRPLPDGVVVDADGFAVVDIEVDGRSAGIAAVKAAGKSRVWRRVDFGGRVLLPRFTDAHAHLFKSNLVGRTPNPTHSTNGALEAEALDHLHWLTKEEVTARGLARRLDFTLGCALRHGTRAVRTHLDGLQDDDDALAAHVWREFAACRARWQKRGVELQGVANLFLPAYDPEAADPAMVAMVEDHVTEAACLEGVVLGAYCPFGKCDVAELKRSLRSVFEHAAAHVRKPSKRNPSATSRVPEGTRNRELDVDFHVDEHNDPSFEALALPAVLEALADARKRLGYRGRVVLGHATALCLGMPGSTADGDAKRVALIKAFGDLDDDRVAVICNPHTNQALQDRQGTVAPIGLTVEPQAGPRTPAWRGLTALQELRAAGVLVGCASDNVRDWWYAYGDYDMLDVGSTTIRMAHLDSANAVDALRDSKPRPHVADWLLMLSRWPARAIGVPCGAEFAKGATFDGVAFDARSVSELLSRPHADRAVIVNATLNDDALPAFHDLDDITAIGNNNNNNNNNNNKGANTNVAKKSVEK